MCQIRCAIWIVLAFAIGCGGTEIPRFPGGGSDGGVEKKVPDPPKLSTGIPTQTCDPVIAITGWTTPGAHVVADGLRGTFQAVASATGDFCLAVDLQSATYNRIDVRALNPAVGSSSSVTVEIEQQDCGERTGSGSPTTSESKNVALGATVSATDDRSPDEGTPGAMVDGNASTWVEYSYAHGWLWYAGSKYWGSPSVGWVRIDLAKAERLKEIKIRWLEDGWIGDEFVVLISALNDADTDEPTHWSKVYEQTSGSEVTSISLNANKPIVRSILIALTSDDGWHPIWEYFEIAEVEAWSAPFVLGNVEPNVCQQ